MKRIAPLLVAGLVGTSVAIAANAFVMDASPVAMTRHATAVSFDSSVPAARIICPTPTTAIAQLNAVKLPYHTYRYITIVNGVTTHSGYAKANSAGVVSAGTGVVNLRTSNVAMRLNTVLSVNTYVSPRCGQPVLPAGYVAAPTAGGGGSSSSYTLHKNSNGTVTRWNPCDGYIHYRVNPTGGGSYALQDTIAAIKAVGASTGLHFVYDGTTTFIPRSTNSASQPAKLVVAWASRTQTDYLASGAIGEGGWKSSGTSTDGSTWTWKITQGFVVVDPAAKLIPGFARGVSRGALLLHELGHITGLGHANDASQAMDPVLSSVSYGGFGNGDKAGLAAVGATHGCVTAR